MANAAPDFYLVSTEDRKFGEPRACYRLKRMYGDGRDDYLLIRIDPPIIGQRYGLGARDIDKVIIATRHSGGSLFPINEWGLHVHVARVLMDNPESREVIHDSEMEEIDWAALAPTMEEAEKRRIPKPRYVREDER
jgi:hypothetical protein